ncbi:MAG TPA: efflux RND transporter periplasmic adaptor subunit, partial [Chitinophagaceae bacterium]|nr:efflux RND transporter periplasmic adaptor subunit [Chitinophagaceae bacterium]
YPGTVTALNEVEIRPQVSGYITGIFFTDGQRVTKGQKLYTIDEQQYRATYNQSVANLNVAKANQARAQQDADRYNELARKDAIARQTLDHALADLEASKMQVAAAQANVNNVQATLGYSVITSPLSGTIGISQVKMGAAVAPGQSILNTVSSDNPIAVDFAVDEKQISRFSLLKQKGGKTSDSTFRILLPDQSIYPVAGTLAFLDRAVDPQTGTIRARVVFKNTNGLLKPGLSCTIRVENNGNEKKILIPYKAVVEQMGEYFVYVVKDSIVTQSKVQLGTRINENIIVNEGLQTGMYIASEGVQKLRDGARVKVSQDSIPGDDR